MRRLWQVRASWRRRDEDATTDPMLPAHITPPVAELFEALTAEPRAHELVGMAESLSLYRSDIARTAPTPGPARRTAVLTSLIGARTGAAIAGVAIGLGAASVVAYSATRPPTEPVMISPAAATDNPDAKPADRPVGPDATGPAAFGLCNAWANHQKQQDGVERAEGSIAMRNLAIAAGGEDKIAAYCATIPHPGNGPKGAKGPKKDKGAKTDDDGEMKDSGESSKTKPTTAVPTATPTPTESPEPSQSGTLTTPGPPDLPLTPSTPSVSPSSEG
jgi:hypothetical protein